MNELFAVENDGRASYARKVNVEDTRCNEMSCLPNDLSLGIRHKTGPSVKVSS